MKIHKLFTYKYCEFQLFRIESIKTDRKILTLSEISVDGMLENINESSDKYIIDITSLLKFLRKFQEEIYRFESFFEAFDEKTMFIIDETCVDSALELLKFNFCDFEALKIDIDKNNLNIENTDATVKKITNLNKKQVESFYTLFENKIYGHSKFKVDFRKLVHSFRIFNRIGEHKVLSLFLMGESGIGKTEVARSIHKAFDSKKKLAKISLGNYSSHDALNSLIGSPRGYIGSEDGGELFIRVKESDVGIILIDEFEKADFPVFNYFLDVLENGKMVNSLGEEIDINGYIMIFTSNVNENDFPKYVSPELRSRFDYKGVFNYLSDSEKEKFVKSRVSEIVKKYNSISVSKLDDSMHAKIYKSIDVSQFKNMRDLNKAIKDEFSCILD